LREKTSESNGPLSPAHDIIKKGSIITLITLISRPLGYVRVAVQAYLFGATLLVDAFVVAFNFPELIQTLFLSGATSAFLVPVCTKYMKDDREYADIYSTFLNLSILITLLLSAVFFLFSGEIVGLIAPGFNPEAKKITEKLFLIMVPVIALHAILSVMKAFLNAKEHFAAPELSGIIWNLVFILAAIVLSKRLGIYSLAIGVTLGSALQIAVQYPYLKKFNIRYRATLRMNHPSILEAKRLFTGALIATSIVPINSFVGRIIASYLPHGEVASLAYAFRIFILPFSLFAVPVYTVMFTKISTLFHEKDMQRIHAHIDSSIILLCITLIPSTILLCSAGEPIVRILYERGAFTAKETALTSRALFGYGIGVLFYALSLSFVRVFNALHDTKTPALVGISSIIINAILALLLMKRFSNLGIALATSIVSLYNFSMLYLFLKKRIQYSLTKKSAREIIKALLSGILLVLLISAVNHLWSGKAYLTLSLDFILTILVYSLFFKSYYSSFLRRKS
jgi:putative peptidoglycan lipid II flippase